MTFLEGAGVEIDIDPPTWLDRFCDDYQSYLVSERALLPSTIVGYLAALRAFVAHAHISGRVRLEMLSAVEVRAFALAEARRLTPKGAGNRMGGLRSLLHYLYVSGVTSAPLGAAGAVDRRMATRRAPAWDRPGPGRSDPGRL